MLRRVLESVRGFRDRSGAGFWVILIDGVCEFEDFGVILEKYEKLTFSFKSVRPPTANPS
jgi:hypothetical protein